MHTSRKKQIAPPANCVPASCESGESLLQPRSGFGADECLRAGPSAQAQPNAAAFALDPQVNVEERTAAALLLDPFGEHRERLRIGGKFEFVAVRQFADRD